MRKILKGALAAFLFLTVVFAGCVGQSKPQAKEPMVIVRATFGEPESVDPAFDYETAGGDIIQAVYEELVWYDGSDITKVIPWLAESYTVSPDGMTYTFVLRKGVKFHDGTDFNADAAVYSIQRAMKMGLDPAWILTDYADSDGVKKIDDYTMSITTKFAYAGFLQCLAYTIAAIVSPKAVEDHGGIAEGKQNEWMDRNAVGTGPFVLESWEAQQQITLAKNTNYWGGPHATGLAKADKIIIRNMPDENTRILALKTGEADFATITPQHLPDVVGQPGIVVDQIGVSPCINYLGVNYRADKFPMLQDMNVRAAISHATDVKTLINRILMGWGVPAQGAIPFSFFGHNPDLPYHEFDLAKAKDFLSKSKYPNGFKITMSYNAGNDVRKQLALMMKDNLAQIGIEVEVKEYDWPTYLKLTREGALPLWIIGWCPDFADPDDYVQPFYVGMLASRAGYKNDEMKALVEAGQRELDPAKRKDIYYKIQQKDYDEYTWIWLHSAKAYVVHRDNLSGLVYNNMIGANVWYYPLEKTPTTPSASSQHFNVLGYIAALFEKSF